MFGVVFFVCVFLCIFCVVLAMLCRSRRVFRAPSVATFSGSHVIPKADDADLFPLRERQESLLFEKLPRNFTTASDLSIMTGIPAEKILLMKSRIGEFTGRAIALAEPNTPLPSTIPPDVTIRSLDRTDTELFVEQCERYFEFSDDLRRLAKEAGNEGFHRIVTLTGIPKTYKRSDVAAIISEATKNFVKVENLSNIVFRFKKDGYQSDTCFVLLESPDDALAVIKAVQEYAVPQRRIHGTSFGCSFVFADRSSLFVSHPDLDYSLGHSKYWVMTLGWNSELDESQMATVLNKMAIYPNKIVKVPGGSGGEFFLRFDRMKNTKLVFSRLNRLKRRWRIGSNIPFFAYPVRADIHFEGDAKHADEASDCDSDLDEPVMY